MKADLVATQKRAAYAGFAVFGAFWGVWGASVPALRDQAGLDDGQLGTALLFIGAGALPAMVLTGRAVDRWGLRVSAVLLLALGCVGIIVAQSAQGLVGLSAGLTLLGATSGAADVAINAAAGTAERASGRPVITRAHGVFSACVVVGSLGTGLLLGGGAAVTVPFLAVACAGIAAAVVTGFAAAGTTRPRTAQDAHQEAGPLPGQSLRERLGRGLRLPPLIVVGGLAALAFAVENAHQNWSSVYLSDALAAGPTVASAGPAVFAAVVAVTRFAVSALSVARPTLIVVGGAAAAATGTAVLALASSVAVALVGLGLAAAGTAVLYPTLLKVATDQVDEANRGSATSVIASIGYLGFLAGPVYVGQWAGGVGLPGALLAVAALAAALALLAPPTLRTLEPARVHPQPARQDRT